MRDAWLLGVECECETDGVLCWTVDLSSASVFTDNDVQTTANGVGRVECLLLHDPTVGCCLSCGLRYHYQSTAQVKTDVTC